MQLRIIIKRVTHVNCRAPKQEAETRALKEGGLMRGGGGLMRGGEGGLMRGGGRKG